MASATSLRTHEQAGVRADRATLVVRSRPLAIAARVGTPLATGTRALLPARRRVRPRPVVARRVRHGRARLARGDHSWAGGALVAWRRAHALLRLAGSRGCLP